MFNGDAFRQAIRSRPYEVFWAGWLSNTNTLQMNGWQISADHRNYQDRLQLILHHPEYGITGLTDTVRRSAAEDFCGRPPVFTVQCMATKMLIRAQTVAPISAFEPVDTRSHVMRDYEEVEYDISGIPGFFVPVKAPKEIIVEPASVAELLAKIREMQLPEQEAIRARNNMRHKREELREASLPFKLHANIISLAA